MKRYIHLSDGTILDREKVTAVTDDPNAPGWIIVSCDNGEKHHFVGLDVDIVRDAFVEDNTPKDPDHVWKERESDSGS